MPQTPQKSSYQSILSDIEALCLNARKALGQMYWGIGRRIVEAEQEGDEKAPYGKQLIVHLSQDLTAKFGNGFSRSNLASMRKLYLENRIFQPAGKLPMSLQIEALTIKDSERRKMLLEKAIRKNLNREQFRELLHNEKILLEPQLTKIEPPKKPAKLSVTRSRLYTYQIIEPSYIHTTEENVTVDVGFSIDAAVMLRGISRPKQGEIVESAKTSSGYNFKLSDAKNKELYTYKALVERVVDADTIYLNIDCGFDIWYREKVRLRGIDALEIATKQGLEAKKFVEAKLKEVSFVVVKTYKEDKYERFLADVFYPPLELRRAGQKEEPDAYKVLEQGVFLNQELLDKGLARLWE